MINGFGRGLDARTVFHAVREAMAAPAQPYILFGEVETPGRLSAGAAALALTFCRSGTAIWLDEALARDPEVTEFLKSRIGARIVPPAEAAFAFVSDPARLPALEDFSLGTSDHPDRSTMLIVQVPDADGLGGWRLSGPGIEGERRLRVEGLRPDFAAERAALAPLLPRGLDVIFVEDHALLALPRTIMIQA